MKEPMDLGTILSRLRHRAYADEDMPQAFAQDVRLVFHNCQAYNLPGSVLHQFSVELEAKFDEYFRAWVESDGRPADAVIPLP